MNDPMHSLADDLEPEDFTYSVPWDRWFLSLIVCDGILTIVVVAIPWLIQVCFPADQNLMEACAMVIPIGAFFVRFVVGYRAIIYNDCAIWFRVVQCCVLFMAALFFVIGDLMAVESMNQKGGIVVTWQEWAVLLTVYFAMMLIPTFPGLVAQENPYRTRF